MYCYCEFKLQSRAVTLSSYTAVSRVGTSIALSLIRVIIITLGVITLASSVVPEWMEFIGNDKLPGESKLKDLVRKVHTNNIRKQSAV